MNFGYYCCSLIYCEEGGEQGTKCGESGPAICRPELAVSLPKCSQALSTPRVKVGVKKGKFRGRDFAERGGDGGEGSTTSAVTKARL